MARNRLGTPRDEKTQEILDVAREKFLAAGYRATTIESVATGANIAPNAVLWYFGSKDKLFAATLHSILDGMQSEAAAAFGDDRLTNLSLIFETIEPYRPLHGVVSIRMNQSPELREFYDRVHRWVGESFLEAAEPYFDEATDRELLLDLIHVVVDGHASSDRRGRPFTEVVKFLLHNVVKDSTIPTPPEPPVVI